MTVRFSKPVGDRLAHVTGDANLLNTSERKNWLRKPTGLVFLFEEGEGCACSMLTDEADWGQPYWDLRPEVLPVIANTVERLASSIKEPFQFEALWAGDHPEQNMAVTATELADLIKAGKIGQKITYNVKIGEQPDPCD
ncbi:MAG: hypothetical protein JSU70_21020 [Phycisphaerales bacterium]|nr:MAG: hypothetical protein JSU70_21020 [Phycisphaerales bacterium]